MKEISGGVPINVGADEFVVLEMAFSINLGFFRQTLLILSLNSGDAGFHVEFSCFPAF